MTKDEIIEEYKKIKKEIGKQPSSKDFYDNSSITTRILGEVFGAKAFSKLVEACGDTPNLFSSEKSDLNDIFHQYGNLSRRLKKPPITYEWDAECRPSVKGITKSHRFRWSEMPNKFLEFAAGKDEWDDVVSLISNHKINEEIIENKSSEKTSAYLMYNKKTKRYKIGFSKDPIYRERTLQSEEPQIITICSKEYPDRDYAFGIEALLHNRYAHGVRRGEWFDLREEEVDSIIEFLNS